MWSRWACCSTPVGVAFLGRDGIYIATEQGAVNISDAKLYPLFPHDGQPASSVSFGSSIIEPVDMTALNYLRLTYCDETIRFAYVDVVGNSVTLIYEIYKKRWLPGTYADQIWFHYLVEPSVNNPNQQEILMASINEQGIFLAGGNTDNGTPITTLVLTPSNDSGDERSQKLYVDAMIKADGTGAIEMAASYDWAQSFAPVITLDVSGAVTQFQENLASLANLGLHRNIGAKFSWTGGPAGPRLYAWEPSGYVQPYLSQFLVTQYINLSFPGWKMSRRAYPALISNAPVLLTIMTQDGRAYGPITIPSTNGQYRQFPTMLPQTIKDLAFAFQLDGQGQTFALFPKDFVIEFKDWGGPTFIDLAVFAA
jgi:hypothetical protein